MKRSGFVAAILLGLLLWAQPASAAWTLVASTSDWDSSSSTTTPAIDTTASSGADLIVILVGSYQFGTAASGDVVDSASNTWVVGGQNAGNGDGNEQIVTFYCINPTTSATHTFTVDPLGSGQGYPSVIVYAFRSGTTATFNTAVGTGATGGGGTTIQPGSLGSSGDLVVSATSYYSANGSHTIDSSFSAVTQINYAGFAAMGTTAAWKEISGAVNPTWTYAGAESSASGRNLAFTPGGGGPSCTAPPNQLLMVGVGNCRGDEAR